MMKLLIIPAVVAAFVLSSTGWATEWDISIDMDRDPWSDSGAPDGGLNWGGTSPQSYWGTRQNGTVGDMVSQGYYRNIDTSATAGDTTYFTLNNTALNNAGIAPDFTVGFETDVRFRIHNGTIPGGHGIIFRSDGSGGTEDGYIAIQPYYRYSGGWQIGFRIDNGGGAYTLVDIGTVLGFTPSPGGPTGWLPTTWLTVNTLTQNGSSDITLNGIPVHTLDLTAGINTAGTDEVQFGDLSSGAAGQVDYDYVRFANVPEPGTLSLLVCAAALLARKRRRV